MWLPTLLHARPTLIGNKNNRQHTLFTTKLHNSALHDKFNSFWPPATFAQIISRWTVINTLTFLMNDIRLKSLYRTTKTTTPTTRSSSSSIKKQAKNSNNSRNSNSKSTSSTALTTLITPTSASSASNNNNNNPRTYNNSSKSNKVFLHYIPRDPRLRIFNKTAKLNKHFGRRTQSELNITEDLCNYGELIGGNVNLNVNVYVYQLKVKGQIANAEVTKLKSN